MQRRQIEWCRAWVISAEQLIQCTTQGIYVGASVGLGFAVLLWRSEAWGTQHLGISRAPRSKDPRDTKVDELDLAVGRQHDVAGLEIPEDDGRLLAVKIAEHRGDLLCPAQHICLRQAAAAAACLLVLLQRLAVNIVHDQIMAGVL